MVCQRFTAAAVEENGGKSPEPDEIFKSVLRTEFPNERNWIVEVHHSGMEF